MSSKLTEYKGLVLATLEITPSDPQHGDEVEFTQSCSGGRAVFLMKVKEYESGKFKAKYVSPERAARHVELFPKLNMTNKDTLSPLFVVHGFNVQPAGAMSTIADKWQRFTDAGLKYYSVPVLWPCNEDGTISTLQTKKVSPRELGRN